MELRPRSPKAFSRSRSRTPFLVQEVEAEAGNRAEEVVVRTTRRTVTAVVKSNEIASSSSDEINTIRQANSIQKSQSNKNSSKNCIFKTSDYSSEDGEAEVTSSKTVNSQNERNQLLEDARGLVNGGSDMPALDLYKKSGRYWEVYPKTDWTYSQHSKDRVEIAPGVVAMPNMSRRTIHSLDDSGHRLSYENMYSDNVSHKNINTDFTTTSRYSRTLDAAKSSSSSSEYFIKRRTHTHTRWTSFKQTITTVFMSVFTMFSYVYRVQTAAFSQIHRAASKVMLWDTYLVWKRRPGNKLKKLVLLCLVPLLLFGGFWLLSGPVSDYTSTASNLIPTVFWSNEADSTQKPVTVESSDIQKPVIVDSSFTKDQIDAIAMAVKNSLQLQQVDTEEIVDKLVNNQNFINIINNNYQESNKHLIENLLKEIENMKQNILLNNQLRQEDFSKLSLDMKKCCKSPINIESHISTIITDLLNNPEFLKDQKGLNQYLQSLFVAKQHLELHLANITTTMDLKVANLVQKDSKLIMDNIANNLLKSNNVNVDEANIKKIVKQALVIYDADRTGLVDYAMENMGGQIVTTRCTELYHHGKAVVSLLGVPLWHMSNSPRTVITPTMAPGDCWAFQNFPGFVVVKLSNTIKIDAFSMEHISRLLVPGEKMDSAPKEFEVFGLHEENDKNPVLLGKYLYNYHGDSLQFFPVEKDNQVFDMIEIRIVSNHGNPNYTCLYRFRVHGKLHQEPNR